MNDTKLVRWLLILLVLPLTLVMFSQDRFRYPCQDPSNWDKDMCNKPLCDVTRTCPEHVFKGQRDPRLGMPDDQKPIQTTTAAPAQGVTCGK